MTKSELIETLAEQHAHVPVKDVENAVKEILEQMAGSLSTSDRIEIRGFGSFCMCSFYLPATTRLGNRCSTNDAWAAPRGPVAGVVPIFNVQFLVYSGI